MAFTDHCDIFALFHEDGLNAILRHVRQQRPSLFNYGSLGVIANPALLCRPIGAHPVVTLRNNPLMTQIDPLPIPGTSFAMELAVQVTDVRMDFHPGQLIALPPELTPLPAQRLAIAMGVCIGLGCPREFRFDQLIEPPQEHPKQRSDDRRPDPPRPLPTRSLIRVCLEVFAVGGVRIRFKPIIYLEPFLDRIEIFDVSPDALELALECYLALMLKLSFSRTCAFPSNERRSKSSKTSPAWS